uniref:Uncharacterized protein n=1 Tax=viral metagenome TaxID=1070528 RepID=A0A6C0H7R6_9ZZZZ
MNIELLLSFQNHSDLQNLDNSLLFTNNKNNLIKIKKMKHQMTILNKMHLILNKLSENNINNIVSEFIDTINYITFEEYNIFLKNVYLKILSEINFITIYLKFLELVNYLYYKIFNYNLDYFIHIIKNKFNYDYLDITYEDIIEDNRINNIILIKNLYEFNMIIEEAYISCENILFTQIKFPSDIYYWKPEINDQTIIKINNMLSNELCFRDKILIESLLTNDTDKSIFYLELKYIINEYINSNDKQNIINFIITNCNDSITKNNFCIYTCKILDDENEKINKILSIFKKNISKYDILNIIKTIKNPNIINYLS